MNHDVNSVIQALRRGRHASRAMPMAPPPPRPSYNQEFIEANTYRHPGPQPFQFQPPAPSWFTGDHPYVHTPQVGDHRTFLQDPQAPQGFLYPHHVQLPSVSYLIFILGLTHTNSDMG